MIQKYLEEAVKFLSDIYNRAYEEGWLWAVIAIVVFIVMVVLFFKIKSWF